jgi:hypothetical protein
VARPTPGNDPPRLRRGKRLRTTKTGIFALGTRSSAVSPEIVAAVSAMGGVGRDAEREYQKALRSMRAAGARLMPELAELYRKIPGARFADRWSVVQLLAELEDEAALELLTEIAGEPLPRAPRGKKQHELTAAREVVIRTTAVEGIARLARAGSAGASDALLDRATSSIFSVKRAAAQAFIEANGESALRRLRRRLGPGDRQIADIRRIDVRAAAPVTPGDVRSRADQHQLPRLKREKGSRGHG